MEFRDTQPIYLQIADFVCEKILLKQWAPDERIPSVREMAVQLGVNHNTVMRTYEFLQELDVIYNQRGIGVFVSPGAFKNALRYRKDQFTEKDLPFFFRNLYLLEMELSDIDALYTKYKKQHFPPSKKY